PILTSGNKITNNKTPYATKIYGQISIKISSTDILAIPEATKSITPTGGVIIPNIRFITIKKPKCIGSIPYVTEIGARTGASIIIAADPSINNPTINKINAIISKNTIKEVEKE